MGLPLFDYFREGDALQFNIRILTLCGFWPLETKSRIVKVAFIIYSFLCMFSISHVLFVEFLDIYLIREDLFRVMKNLCATSASLACVYKQLFVSGKFEQVKKLLKKLEDFKKSSTEPEDQEILKRAKETIWTMTKAIYGLGLPCIGIWMLFPALESGSKRHIPYPYRLPVISDKWWSPVYEIVYAYECLSLFGFMVAVLTNDLIYFGITYTVTAEFEILARRLESLEVLVEPDLNNNEESDEIGVPTTVHDPIITEKACSIVKKCSETHQIILRKINDLETIYSDSFVIHFFVMALLTGIIIIDIIVVSKGFRLQLLQRVIYTATGILDTFLCCYCNSEMEEKGLLLRQAIYSAPWYKLNSKVRKDLSFMLLRAERPSVLRVGKWFPLNLKTFLTIMKLSYNIIALFYQTIKP